MNRVKRNWRELAGWVLIFFLFLNFITNDTFHRIFGGLTSTFETFEAIATLVAITLGWLWLNRKSN